MWRYYLAMLKIQLGHGGDEILILELSPNVVHQATYEFYLLVSLQSADRLTEE